MHESWKEFLNGEFVKPYFKELSNFLKEAYAKTEVFPKKTQVFSAFTTDLNGVKVVILGQDPYHTPGAAHGLAFSVPPAQPVPPSLKNIYKEIESDLGRPSVCAPRGYLGEWQKQGVLLLNNVLTVEAHRAGSHRQKGWETFTEATVRYLDEARPHLVFLLWGRDARSKKSLVNTQKHLVLESPHPSPLSAHAGFFGNHHFSRANQFLAENGLAPIEW